MKHSLIGAALLILALPMGINANEILPSEAPPVLNAPLIRDVQPAEGNVVPVNGKVMVKLVNKTNAKIRYQFLGDLSNRQNILEGRASSNLVELPVPISLTFRRMDNGLLKVTAKSITNGILEVELDETSDFNIDRISLWVSPRGAVYLN